MANFLSRYTADHDDATWQEIKDELTNLFGDVVDASHALAQMQNLKQKEGESVSLFAERILEKKTSDVFQRQDLQDEPLISRQLIDVYIEGLTDANVTRRIMRNDPADFTAAVNIAVAETKR